MATSGSLARRRARAVLGVVCVGFVSVCALGWGAGPLALAWLWPASLVANLLVPLAAIAGVLGLVAALARRPVLAALLIAQPGLVFLHGFHVRPLAAEAGAAGTALRLVVFNPGDAVATPDDVLPTLAELDPDVIALCELNERMATGLERELGERYPHRVAYALGWRGRGLWSKHPIVAHEFAARGGARRHLDCTLSLADVPLRLVVVHLDLSVATRGLDAPSVQDCLAYGRELAGAGEPGLIVGDYNSSTTSSLYARLHALGMTDAYREGGGAPRPSFPIAGRYPPLPFVPPLLRIDHAFRTDGLRAVHAQLGPDAGGDHLPMVLDLVVQP